MQTIKYAILRAGGLEGMYNIAIYAINNQLITSSIYLNPTSSNDQASTIKRIASDSAYALKLPLLTQTLDLEDIKLAQQKIYGSASPSDYDTWDSIERYPNDLLNCADCINNWSGDITAAIDESSSRYCPPDEDEAPLLNTHKRDATLGDLSTAEIIHYLESQGDMYLHYWHQDDLEERLIADGFHPGEENFAVFKSELEAWLGSAEHFQSFAINHIFNCHQPLWQF